MLYIMAVGASAQQGAQNGAQQHYGHGLRKAEQVQADDGYNIRQAQLAPGARGGKNARYSEAQVPLIKVKP